MEEKKILDRYINYEVALSRLFRELNLKANQCQLIRAFILVSKGEKEFEASFTELAAVFQKKKENQSRPDTTAKNAFNGLKKWQEENKMELIRVLRKGSRVNNPKKSGIYEFIKPKYRFVMLDELVKVLHSDSENLDAAINEVLEKIKAEYKPVEKKRKLTPLKKLQRARNSIYTLMRQAFDYAYKAGLKPRQKCEEIIDQTRDMVNELNAEQEYKHNRDKFIKEFERMLENGKSSQEKEKVTE